jgi:hypothetical protein
LYAPPAFCAPSELHVVAIIAYPTSLLGKAHLIAFQTEISHISSRLSLAIFEE